MNELAQHIEVLLLENDCVVIPEFGGFVTHYVSAKRMDEEKIFLPPTRVIGFNPSLKMNDGLLVQSYMKRHNVTFPEATRMVKKEVEKLISRLQEKGKIDLINVGEIHYTTRGTYDFVPYDNKITTPYLYGLDSFEMKELSELNPTKEPEAKGIRIFISYLRYAVAAAAAVLLFFFMSDPVENTNIEERNYAQLLPGDLFKQSVAINPTKLNDLKKTGSQALVTANSENVEETIVSTSEKQEVQEVKVSEPAEVKKANVKTNKYHIIVSSGGKPQVAKNSVSLLKKSGYSDAQILSNNGKMRISIMSFPTHNEAYRNLLLLRQKKAYQDAWIMTHS